VSGDGRKPRHLPVLVVAREKAEPGNRPLSAFVAAIEELDRVGLAVVVLE